MNSLAEVHFIDDSKLEARRPNVQTEREQDRWAWWIRGIPLAGAKEAGIRQMAVRLGDFVAGCDASWRVVLPRTGSNSLLAVG